MASPELTGGAGFTFEDCVSAYYLTALLAESTARGLKGGVVPTQVSLQRSALGHPLDDIVVSADTPDGPVSLDLQVKSAFSFKATPSNTDFFDIVRQASETLESKSFRLSIDRIGVATAEIAPKHLRDLNTVCDWARDSLDAQDFRRRIELPDFASQAKRDIVAALRDGLARALKRSATEEEVHRFFQHFVLLRFDPPGEAAAEQDPILDRLERVLAKNEPGAASDLWTNLRLIAREASGRAGGFDRDGLRARLGRPERFASTRALANDIGKLTDEARLAFTTIETSIDGFVLPRETLREEVDQGLADQKMVLIVGRPGSGKSALVRAMAERNAASPMICLRSDRVAAGGWPAYARSLGLTQSSPLLLLREMAFAGEPILFIDGLDRLVGDARTLVQELVGLILDDPSLARWRIVASLRDEGWVQVRRWLAAVRNLAPMRVDVGNLTDEEAQFVARERPRLHDLLFGASDVQEIARRPFFLNVLASAIDLEIETPSSETELIAAWWAGGGYDAEGAERARRQEALVAIARASAATLGRRARIRGLDHEALESLKTDRVLVDAEPGHTVSFAHDIFFEWAFAHLLMDAEARWLDELLNAGEPPALGRPVELLSQLRFERDQDWARELDRLEGGDTRTQWRRAWLMAPFSSPHFSSGRAEFSEAVFPGVETPRLAKLLTWFQAERSEPGSRAWGALGRDLSETAVIRLADALATPNDFAVWARFLNWLIAEQSRLPMRLWPSVLTCAEVWQNALSHHRNPVSEGLLALAEAWIARLEDGREAWLSGKRTEESGLDHHVERAFATSARRFIFRASVAYPEFTRRYLQRLLAQPKLSREAIEAVIDAAAFVAHADPQLLSDVLLAQVLQRLPRAQLQYEAEDEARRRAQALEYPEGSHERELLMPSGLGGWINRWDWDHLAIEGLHRELGPSSPITEPFQSLFKESSEIGLRTVKAIANHAISAWRELHELDDERDRSPLPLTLDFPWGQQAFWGEDRDYVFFRGVFGPHVLTAGVMVLEAWAFTELEGGTDLDELLQKVIEGCEHNAILGIACALAMTRPAATPATLPLASSQRLWRWDMGRIARIDNASVAANLIGAIDDQRALVALRASNARPARRHWIGQLSVTFMVTADDPLREAFQAAIAGFPDDLALDFAEQEEDEALVAERRRLATRWAQMGRTETYVLERTEEGVLIQAQPPPLSDAADIRQAAELDQTSRWLALAMWAARTFDDAPPADGGLTDDAAIAEARALDEEDLFSRGGGLGDPEDMRRAGVAGAAALVLRTTTFQDEALLDWAQGVMVRAYRTPLDGEGLLVPETVMIFHPAKYVPIGLAAVIRRGLPLEGAGPALLGMIAWFVHEISAAAARAAYSLADVEPAFAAAALQLMIAISVRTDTPLARFRNREAADQTQLAASNEALDAAVAVAKGQADFALPSLPARPDDDDDDRGRFRDEIWLDTAYLEKHLGALAEAPEALDLHLDAIAGALLTWTIEQGVGSKRGGELIVWRGALMRWLAQRASPSNADQVIETIIAPIGTLDDEPCLALLGPFIATFVAREVHDAEIVAPGTISIMAAAAERAAKLDPRWRSTDEADSRALLRDLLCVPGYDAANARRFANGEWGELPMLWPVLDAMLPALSGRRDFARAWLALVEHAITHYPIDRFAIEAVAVLEALPADELADEVFRSKLGAAMQALDERAEQLSLETRGRLLRLLDTLIDHGDRRAASLQRSERFRIAPRDDA